MRKFSTGPKPPTNLNMHLFCLVMKMRTYSSSFHTSSDPLLDPGPLAAATLDPQCAPPPPAHLSLGLWQCAQLQVSILHFIIKGMCINGGYLEE